MILKEDQVFLQEDQVFLQEDQVFLQEDKVFLKCLSLTLLTNREGTQDRDRYERKAENSQRCRGC